MASRDLFVNSIEMLMVGDQASVPTAILYSSGSKPAIGTAALNDASDNRLPNENFKIELGRINPGSAPANRARFVAGDGTGKSAFELASDFLGILSQFALESLRQKGLSKAHSVLVSEPLNFYADDNEDWLQNYRGNITRILQSKFSKIEYLPEPFAVFQYYRYGARHKTVALDKKYFALVVDFGGGTFDVSIVETTNTGDIAMSGRHSRPLGAHSRPIGGYEINALIGRYLINREFGEHRDREIVQKCIANYVRWQRGELAIADLSARNQAFMRAYRALLRSVERKKIELSKAIMDWSLKAPLRQSVRFDFPEDPFASSSRLIELRFSAEELREIFEKEVWARQLKACVKGALERASGFLRGRPIQVALMSGGSANLRWLEALLRRDFEAELRTATVVTLAESYQEVVAKGLAIECARRAYDPRSEFTDVTYNPLYLVLDPDGRGEERRTFRRLALLSNATPALVAGQLLESATALEGDREQELEWKVRLEHPPKHFLDYYFLRDPSNTGALENRYNIVNRRAQTPRETRFESHIRVRLAIRSDGTCTTTFVYCSDKEGRPTHYVSAEPFWLDMVPASQDEQRPAYLGIDFGTSASAVSYVDWQQVQVQEQRSRDSGWLQINELTDLAFPLAAPLKGYLASRTGDSVGRAIDALESALALAATVLWADITSANPGAKVRVFGKGWKRSGGPLNKAVFDLLDTSGPSSEIAGRLKKALHGAVRNDVSEAINHLDRIKHQKEEPTDFSPESIIEVLGNALRQALNGYQFGYFSDVRKVGFRDSYKGMFVIANGTPPFHERIAYSGRYAFSPDEAFLVNPSAGIAISLTPLMFWRVDEHRHDVADACYVFDGLSREQFFEFKRIGAWSTLSLKDADPHSLTDMLYRLQIGEHSADRFGELSLGTALED